MLWPNVALNGLHYQPFLVKYMTPPVFPIRKKLDQQVRSWWIQKLAMSLILCLLLLHGMVYSQIPSNALEHPHHQKASHVTVLCNWLCISAETVEGFVAPLSPMVLFVEDIEPFYSRIQGIWLSSHMDSRAPPSVLHAC